MKRVVQSLKETKATQLPIEDEAFYPNLDSIPESIFNIDKGISKDISSLLINDQL